jgi:hypothetical protein
VIEAYAFLAAFALQIFVGSVVNPARLIKYVRGWVTNFGSERLAQLFPDFNYETWSKRFAIRFRAVNIAIAVIGLGLLGWLFTVTQRENWAGEVSNVTILYFLLQMAPLALLGLYAVIHYKLVLAPLQEGKRKASLQRRGLLDFVSRRALVVAVASYVLFIPTAICVDLYVYGNTTLSRYCYTAIFGVTLTYALNAFVIYKTLYGKKNPLVTHEGRAHTIGMTVKSSIYGSIAVVWFVVLMSFVTKLNLDNWRPFALSVFLAVTALLSFIGVTARNPEVSSGGWSG